MRVVREVASAERPIGRPCKIAVGGNVHQSALQQLVRHAADVGVPMNFRHVLQQRLVVPRAGTVVEIDDMSRPQCHVANGRRGICVAPALAPEDEVSRPQLVQLCRGDILQQTPRCVRWVTCSFADYSGRVEPKRKVVHPSHKVAAVQACMHMAQVVGHHGPETYI